MWRKRLIYALLRICRIDLNFEELENRSYTTPNLYKSLNLATSQIDQPLVDLAKDLFNARTSRQGSIDSKVSALLNLTAILLPLSIALIAWSGERLPLPLSGALFGFISLPLLLSVVLLLEYLRLNSYAEPTFDDKLLKASEPDRNTILIKDYLLSTWINDNKADYLADVYRAAMRLFCIATVTSLFGGGITLCFLSAQRPATDAKALVTQLQANPDLINLLRGPQGLPGTQGPVGPQGPRRNIEPTGKSGIPGTVSPPGPIGPAALAAPQYP